MIHGIVRSFTILSVIAFCLIISGCKKPRALVEKKIANMVDYREIIALHSEIPDSMIGFVVDRVIYDASNPQLIEIVYKPSSSKIVHDQASSQKSYVADMELLGWRHIGEFVGETVQLLFERPLSKVLCSVYIEKNGTIRVTLLQKK